MKIYVVPDPNETKFQRFKRGVDARIRTTREWISRNKETIIVLTPVVIGGIATVSKVIGRRVNLKKAENVKNLYCYDNHLGHYWRLRRELTNSEWLEIDRRMKSGERLSTILEDLKVLR